MDKKLFSELVESMTEAGEIARGERASSREFRIGEIDVKRIRRASGLSQATVDPRGNRHVAQLGAGAAHAHGSRAGIAAGH